MWKMYLWMCQGIEFNPLGLNDSYAQIRGQLLFLDPIPPINKVFFLISREERQRSISSRQVTKELTQLMALHFGLEMMATRSPILITTRGINFRRRKSHSASIAIFMATALRSVTRFTVTPWL